MLKTVQCKIQGDFLIPLVSLPKNINKENIIVVFEENQNNQKANIGTQFCGIWQDDRNADEIINDIHKKRTGFGGRDVN